MDCGQKMDSSAPRKGRPPRSVPRPTRHISFKPGILEAITDERAPEGISEFVNEAIRDYLRRRHGVKIP